MKISVIILTKNEEKMIDDCLKSLGFADEILVVDTGNTDSTNSIARKRNATIIPYSGTSNYAAWRNAGLTAAKGDWVLYVDADERVTPLLGSEIMEITKNEKARSGYAIPRRNFIFGKEFKHSGQYPDYQKRLFKKSELLKWTGEMHEEPNFKGELGYAKNAILHKKNMTIREMIEKTNKWSEVEAKLMIEAHHPPMNLPRFGSAIAREFLLRMVEQMAFLDGIEGIIYAIYQVFSKFTSYAKLYEMQLKGENK